MGLSFVALSNDKKMSSLILSLKQIIEADLIEQDAESSTSRFLLKGLPLSVLDELLEELNSDTIGGYPLIVIKKNGAGRISEDGTVLSGQYSEANATAVRNHYDGGYILAIPDGSEVGGSLSKSIEFIDNPADKLLSKLLEELIPQQQDLVSKLPNHINYYVRTNDSGYESKAELLWKVLHGINRLCFNLPREERLRGIFFVLGLPSCTPDDVISCSDAPSKLQSVKILVERKNSISRLVFDLGISGAFKMWQDENQDDVGVCDALGECKKHILKQVASGASFFASPRRFYGFGENDEDLPMWHKLLDKDKWYEIINRAQPVALKARIELSGYTGKMAGNVFIYPCNQPIKASCINSAGDSLEASNWEVSDASGNVLLDGLADGSEIEIESLPPHSGRLILRACPDGGETIKSAPFVSLSSFEKKIVFLSNGEEEKLTLPEATGDNEDEQDILTCEVNFPRTGGYSSDLYFGPECKPGKLYAIDADESGITEEKDLRCIKEEANIHRFQLVTDASCVYEVRGCKYPDGRLFTLKIEVTAEDGEPLHSTSWLEVLRAQQITDKNFLVTALSSDNEFAKIQNAKLIPENKDSYLPLAADLSSSSLNISSSVSWAGTILGEGTNGSILVHDIRPDQIDPPEELLSSWSTLRTILLKASDNSGILEGVRFFDLVLDLNFRQTRDKYLTAYNSWMESEPQKACWWEVVTLHENMEQAAPDGMLLSPLHPLRLGWICDAQEVLEEAAQKKAMEGGRAKGMPPLVGLDSVHAPGFWVLHTQDTSYPFYSLRTSGSYWGLLVSADNYSSQEKKDKLCKKLAELGINVPPSGTPLDDAHIHQILDEVDGFKITRRTLKIGLQSQLANRQGANSVVDWFRMKAEANENDEKRPDWAEVLPPSVEGYSNEAVSPDSDMLASLHGLSPSELKWFESWHQEELRKKNLDVLLQTEIIPASTSVKDQFMTCPVSSDFLLSRHASIMEPVGADKLTSTIFETSESNSQLGNIAELAIKHRQPPFKALREVYNSASLGVGLVADFFGLPSAGVDPSLVTRLVPGGGVLWKLSLPPYAADKETGSGFFLLARINNQIEKCMAYALVALIKSGTELPEMPPQAKIREILHELGRRGFDSVKHIADQEFLARANLGLLVSSRLLAGHKKYSGILSSEAGDEVGAVIVPMDPFRQRLDKLRATVLSGSGPRPDQLVVGYRICDEKVIIKLTPVETKCYEGRATISTRKEFLDKQCTKFIIFLKAFFLPASGRDFKGWDLARRIVLADWIEYGLNCLMTDDLDFVVGVHSHVISKIIRGNYEVEIDEVGRLVMVDGSTFTEFCRNNELGNCLDLKETLQFNKREAYAFLMNETLPEALEVGVVRNNWNLLPPADRSVIDDNHSIDDGRESNVLTSQSDSGTVAEVTNIEESNNLPADAEDTINTNDTLEDDQPLGSDEGTETGCTEDIISSQSSEELAGTAPKILLGQSDSSMDVYWQPFGEIRPSGERERLLGNSHAYIAGSPGYGKSYLLEKIIGSSIISEGVVPLFFDFVGDFAHSCPSDYNVRNAADGFDMNPLRMLPVEGRGYGKPLTEVYKLASLFRHALGLGDQQENKAREAIQNAYGDYGIRVNERLAEEPSLWPNFSDLGQHVLSDPDERFVARMKAIFDWEVFSGSSGSFGSLLQTPTIVNFQELVEAGETLANAVSQILLDGIFHYLTAGNSCDGLKYLIVIDEAHRVCALPSIEKMLREVRKFGCGVWMASQGPDDFSDQVRSLTTSKFIFRLETDSDARLAERELSAASGSIRHDIRDLSVGECFYRDPINSPFVRLKIRGE